MKKEYSVSLIRLFSLLLIISCHILQGLNLEIAFWLNIGVQIYFFMSGFLYGKKEKIDNVFKWYKKQFSKILIPLIILEIIMLIIDKFLFNISYSRMIIVANLIGMGGFFTTLKTLSHTWFISYIIICYLITPLLQTFEFKKMNKKIFIIVLLAIAIIIQALEIFKCININAAYLFNYILGFAFSNHFINNKINYKSFFFKLCSLTIIILIPRIIIQYELINNIPNILLNNKTYIISWSHVLLGSCIFITLYTLFNKIKIKKHLLLDYSDKYNYYIYLVHQIFILNYLSVLYLTKSLLFNIILIILLSLLFGILLYYLTHLLNKIKKVL